MKQTAEQIARQRIKEDTSKTPQIIIAVIAVVGVLIFILTNFVFKGEDKPKNTAPTAKPTPKAMFSPAVPVQNESTDQSENATEASAEPSDEPTPEASPTEDPAAAASVTPSEAPDSNKESTAVPAPTEASPDSPTEATAEPSPN